MNAITLTPAGMPILARGRHRSAKRGACFMEFASYLAGERWSDHPACTDPTLSMLARMVNDLTSDSRRSELAIEVPRVVGLRGDQLLIGWTVAARAAISALPIASMPRQHALAAGLLGMDESGIRLDDTLLDARDEALRLAPSARAWALNYLDAASAHTQPGRGAIEAMVRLGTVGIAEACVHDIDDRLITLLRVAIADTERVTGVPMDEIAPARFALVE